MELELRPHDKNMYSAGGILVNDTSITEWLKAVQNAGLPLAAVTIYPIPGTLPNTLWGCLIAAKGVTKHMAGRHQLCQEVSSKLYIANNAVLYPTLSAAELDKLLGTGIYAWHPDFGLVELPEAFDAGSHILQPTMRSFYITPPAETSFTPATIKSFRIQPLSPEEALKQLEKEHFPEKEEMKDKPLNLVEKLKLMLYRKMFKKASGNGDTNHTEKSKWWALVEPVVSKLTSKDTTQIQQDYEDLEERNKETIDKLLKMLQKDPLNALKYAIPLNESGSVRGGTAGGSLSLSMRWFDLLWSSQGIRTGNSSGSIDIGNKYFGLQRQYMETAQELIKKGKHHDAAFIYMKLLKNPQAAADTLEKGGHYGDAATIYLKHVLNQKKAAECYEKGNMTMEAIELYKDLKEDEKVGDLYDKLAMRKEATLFYNKAAGSYIDTNQYVKAATILDKKAGSKHDAAEILFEGWTRQRDAVNCLSYYFALQEDTDTLKKEVDRIYQATVTAKNSAEFLNVLQKLHSKHTELKPHLKEVGYEIVANNIAANPAIVSELKAFEPDDKELLKDTMRFKLKKR